MREIPSLNSYTPDSIGEGVRSVYDEMFQECIQDPIGLNEKGVELYNAALALVPEGYELYGTWPENMLDYGVASREDIVVLDCPVHDNQGILLHGYVYLAKNVAGAATP